MSLFWSDHLHANHGPQNQDLQDLHTLLATILNDHTRRWNALIDGAWYTDLLCICEEHGCVL